MQFICPASYISIPMANDGDAGKRKETIECRSNSGFNPDIGPILQLKCERERERERELALSTIKGSFFKRRSHTGVVKRRVRKASMATPVDAQGIYDARGFEGFFYPSYGIFCVHYERQIAATLCWIRLKQGGGSGLKEVIGVLRRGKVLWCGFGIRFTWGYK